MNIFSDIKNFLKLVSSPSIDPEQQRHRIKVIERDIAMPVKMAVLGIMAYFLFFSTYLYDNNIIRFDEVKPWHDLMRSVFLVYVVVNMAVLTFYLFFNSWKLLAIHSVVVAMNLLDATVVAALVIITGGLDSMVYWVFVVLIIRNALTIPVPVTQISLNLLTVVCYAAAISFWKAWYPEPSLDGDVVEQAGNLLADTNQTVQREISEEQRNYQSSLYTIRVFLLVLMTALCYGMQVLVDRSRQAQFESREYTLRREQLRSTGQLAAEIAHRLKNPLAIINNAAFTLQRNVQNREVDPTKQLEMIRSEVERSDMILTELMGYARLSEGEVEKLDVHQELQSSISEAFPKDVEFDVELKQNIAAILPALVMQKAHFHQILVNLLVNAREAAGEGGAVTVSCQSLPNYTIEFRVKDTGQGVPDAQRERIFEAYFTTKEKGTGLGLVIVKRNTELYGGEIHVESELGKGTEFVLTFPTRALLQNDS